MSRVVTRSLPCLSHRKVYAPSTAPSTAHTPFSRLWSRSSITQYRRTNAHEANPLPSLCSAQTCMWALSEFERKITQTLDSIGKCADAFSEAGVKVCAMGTALQRQGDRGRLPSPKTPSRNTRTAMSATHNARAASLAAPTADEMRTILRLRLDKAMQQEDGFQVQQIVHEMDQLDEVLREAAPATSVLTDDWSMCPHSLSLCGTVTDGRPHARPHPGVDELPRRSVIDAPQLVQWDVSLVDDELSRELYSDEVDESNTHSAPCSAQASFGAPCSTVPHGAVSSSASSWTSTRGYEVHTAHGGANGIAQFHRFPEHGLMWEATDPHLREFAPGADGAAPPPNVHATGRAHATTGVTTTTAAAAAADIFSTDAVVVVSHGSLTAAIAAPHTTMHSAPVSETESPPTAAPKLCNTKRSDIDAAADATAPTTAIGGSSAPDVAVAPDAVAPVTAAPKAVLPKGPVTSDAIAPHIATPHTTVPDLSTVSPTQVPSSSTSPSGSTVPPADTPALVLHIAPSAIPDGAITDPVTVTDASVPDASVMDGSAASDAVGTVVPHNVDLATSLDASVDNGSNSLEVAPTSASANCATFEVDDAIMLTVDEPVSANTSHRNVEAVVNTTLHAGGGSVTGIAVDWVAGSPASPEIPATLNVVARNPAAENGDEGSAAVGLRAHALVGAPIEDATVTSVAPDTLVVSTDISIQSAACVRANVSEHTTIAHGRIEALGAPLNENRHVCVCAAVDSRTASTVPEEDGHASVAAQMAGAAKNPLEGIYTVDTVLDMRRAADDKREFLIKWKGWGHMWNSWEPEKHILDRQLLREFHKKRPRQREPVSEPLQQNIEVQLHSKRRCAKLGALKARLTAKAEQDGAECNEEDEDDY